MNPAHASRLAKERNPEHYCPAPRCLWRVFDARTPDVPKPCPKHMAALELQGAAKPQELSESRPTPHLERATTLVVDKLAGVPRKDMVEVLAWNTGIAGQFTFEAYDHRWLVTVSSDEVDHD